ncbi:hypothetical protein HPP92_022335 [Vanilla planifolia]|uniref:ferredoxin--NADP(+) reductase n=1 Tax=Vanilla planifolia TaxID=51239 RepID=A0A835Q0D4_VANPL|nr:hypothetical protein HPP92_022335 [Vanilla planifolia]
MNIEDPPPVSRSSIFLPPPFLFITVPSASPPPSLLPRFTPFSLRFGSENNQMACATVTATFALSASKPSPHVPSARPSSLPCERTPSHKVKIKRNLLLSIRSQITTEAPVAVEKVSKKNEEGVITNKFKPKTPYIGRCLLNTKITGDDAPGETWHMVFSTEGELPYRGSVRRVIADGVDQNGKPHKLRLYSIASSAIGDFGDSKTVSLCVKRLVYTNDQGEIVKGVCSNYLCDLKPGNEVKLTGPVGKEMLMPVDPNATVIMLATGTGIAPFRGFLWKMFFEKHEGLQGMLVLIPFHGFAGK